jgi:hypothetical protein
MSNLYFTGGQGVDEIQDCDVVIRKDAKSGPADARHKPGHDPALAITAAPEIMLLNRL